jgi:hypothetical protein
MDQSIEKKPKEHQMTFQDLPTFKILDILCENIKQGKRKVFEEEPKQKN